MLLQSENPLSYFLKFEIASEDQIEHFVHTYLIVRYVIVLFNFKNSV